MTGRFRQSMAWLHTWTGLLAGWVSYFVFVTGTLGYFYVELDRWMRPELPLAAPGVSVEAFVDAADAYLHEHAADADAWSIALPVGRRHSGAGITWTSAGTGDEENAVPRRLIFDADAATFRDSGPGPRDTGGAYLLYRMHWQLHYVGLAIGRLAVGIATMMLLVALVTGVVTHKKIFADFFTLRPGRGQRAWLDAHNLAGVLTLPFFVMITYSGLVFFTEVYWPTTIKVVYGDDSDAFDEDYYPLRGQPAAVTGQAARMLPLRQFVAASTTYWGSSPAREIQVIAPGDAGAEVRLLHSGQETILRDVEEELHFRAVDGAFVRQVTVGESATESVRSALFGLHEGLFAGLTLRWLFFLSGLLGCVMVATGLVLWSVKRRPRHVLDGRRTLGFAVVEHLNIGTVAGLPVAVAAFFWANRLLPVTLADRAAWEAHCLFAVWAAMLLYPAFRSPRRAWVEELWLAAGAFGLLPVLNAATTERHLAVTVPAGDWAMAAVDLTMLAVAAVLAIVARRVGHSDSRPGEAADAPGAHAAIVPEARL